VHIANIKVIIKNVLITATRVGKFKNELVGVSLSWVTNEYIKIYKQLTIKSKNICLNTILPQNGCYNGYIIPD
jgi:hypothetical protein